MDTQIIEGSRLHAESTPEHPCQLGIDVGSTTVKAVVLDGNRILFSDYRRHNADVRAELGHLLEDIEDIYPGLVVQAAITGSGGLTTARAMKIPFVQEVIAGTESTQRLHPEVDVVIELGGEDAKLTYLHPTPEQRMNGTCAGGTGAFIDQMATLLHTDASGLNTLAEAHTQLYPIASRCGVFAKSDIQPLINQGAAHEDLAASIFSAVATQTIAGLACGRPIRGNVMFLGGPLHFLPQLREAYKTLLPKAESFITPENAQLYVAIGAALLASKEAKKRGDEQGSPLGELIDRLATAQVEAESPRMRPLFATPEEKEEFVQRHAQEVIPKADLSQARGRCWLGIDAGSTTIKAVLIDEDDRIVFTHYASNEGDPVAAAVEIVRRVRSELPEGTVIGRSCATGYGEGLVTAALTMDEGEIETMAHYRAAEFIQPGVTSVIDIGGQDMKYLRIKDHAVDSISVNEACSSGCGSFLQTFAQTMGTDVRTFAKMAMESTNPVDLGTRCTVFMNSSVKQAQKEGADVRDISAGLSYSVVRNALYKVIKLKDPSDLGERVVVQGGTFLNDSVLRAFELLTGREVVRPDIAGLMGAYGAALTARMHDSGEGESSLARIEDLEDFQVETTRKTCRLCQNHCQMTISTFSNGERHVSGNRCERGASLEKVPRKSDLPNLYDWKYKRIFGYRRLTEAKAFRGDIGIPRVLGMYENYPFWFTMLTELGFRVMISGRSNHELFEQGMESIPSENVCYPAKLVHGHIESLLDKGITTIWYPCVDFEQKLTDADNNFNCPVVATYPEVIRNNMERLNEPGVKFISPFINFGNRDYLPAHLVRTFAQYGYDISVEEMSRALDKAWEEDAAVKAEIKEKGREALEWMREHGVRGIVLAGRPYHLDPEINHGIPEVIVGLGMAVLTEDSIIDQRLERPLRVRDQWSYHSRLYEAAARVGDEPDLEMVQLNSFGCGVDAITADQVQEILEGRGDVHTVLKIDEVSNLGAAKIRLRSLEAAVAERGTMASGTIDTAVHEDPASVAAREESEQVKAGHIEARAVFTEEMRDAGYEILAPQMSPIHFRFLEPLFRRAGLNVRVLEHTSRQTMETGLKYVNNDSCYPAIVVIGQLIDEFVSGRADPDKTAVGITQTGGMCRATNYAALLRKGLRDAGYPQVPVIALSVQGLEDNPGFKIGIRHIHKAIQSFVIGDAIQSMLLRVRPYEAVPGSAMELYRRWDQIVREWVVSDRSETLGRVGPMGLLTGRLRYSTLIKRCVAEFDALELRDIPRKPRVGLVGEILVKFHPDANNHAVDVIEAEGCEAELPGLMQFFHNSVATAEWDYENLGIDGKQRKILPMALWLLKKYEVPVHRAFEETNGKFEAHRDIEEMISRSEDIARLGNQAGEGWYLTAEMVDMIEHGCPNIICAQPFACLPNHIVGKGMFRALRNRYPQANIVAVDYDPGASEVNQLNRIKLMLATAVQQHNAAERDGEDDGVLQLVGIDFDSEDLGGEAVAGASCGGCGCGSGGGSSEGEGRRVVGLGMPAMPPRRGAAFR